MTLEEVLGKRLTEDKVAEALEANSEKLIAAGVAVDMSNLRYIKLAEYENEEEMREREQWLKENLNRSLDEARLKELYKDRKQGKDGF